MDKVKEKIDELEINLKGITDQTESLKVLMRESSQED